MKQHVISVDRDHDRKRITRYYTNAGRSLSGEAKAAAMRVFVVLPLLLSALAGCTPLWSVEGFKNPNSGGIKRASFEMECPENQLQVQDLGDHTVGVTGCGQKAVYKWVYGGAGWVNNSAVPEKQ